MNFSSTQDPFPDENFLHESKDEGAFRSNSSRKESAGAYGYLFPIDEAEEFHDPFSELSLFLSKRIKRELLREKNPRKWSQKIQSLLLKEILPEFTKKFPKYRLGNTALKKTWDKVLYHLQLIQQEKNALKPDGKLNIDHFIKQNLKKFSQSQMHADLHPYNRAHNLAVKISECIAAIDGDRPKLDELTKTIWAVQRHLLLKKESLGNPLFEKIDMLDKLVMRFQLEAAIAFPHLGPEDLIKRVKYKIKGLKQLQKIKQDDLIAYLSSLLSERQEIPLNIPEIALFIKQQIEQNPSFNRTLFVKRLMLLYPLAHKISPAELKRNLKSAIHYVLSLTENQFRPECPVLQEHFFTHIESEIASAKEKSVDAILEPLLECFSWVQKLPILPETPLNELEILIWKTIPLQEDLPTYMRELALEEMANIHIDHPTTSFDKCISTAMNYFKKLSEIDLGDLDKKCKIASLQNDMIYSLLSFDPNTPILATIKQNFFQNDFERTIQESTKAYMSRHPSIAGWEKTLKTRIAFMVKYYWYNDLKGEKESAYDRFLKWHFNILLYKEESLFSEILITHLEHISETTVPLFPFNKDHVRTFFTK